MTRYAIVICGASYFGLVFFVGFLLGVVRVLFAVPALGERKAELLEMPLMLLASFFAARWVIRRFGIPQGVWGRVLVGLVALALLVVAELLVVVFVRDESLSGYLASRDPVAGGVYVASLVVFSLMPWLAHLLPGERRRPPRRLS